MNYFSPRRWSITARISLLILNGMSIGAFANELTHGVNALDIALLPLSAFWVLWIASTLQPSSEDA